MEVLLLILRLTLTAVFGIAGIAKIFDPVGAENAFVSFGLPKLIARPMTFILPAVELIIAATLLFVSTAWMGTIGVALILGIFTIAMFYQMAQGRSPDCHCFGQLHSEPVGTSTIVRNTVLLLIAGFLISQGREA